MAGLKVFKCPSCGASISTDGAAAQITCQFCGNTVIVPEELRERPPAPRIAMPYAPQVVVTSTPVITVGGRARRGSAALTLVILAVVACVTLGIIAGAIASIGGTAALGIIPAATALGSLATVDVPGVAATATPEPGFATLALTFGGEGTGAGRFNDPRAIAVDGQGNVYVGEYSVARVQKFDGDGQYLAGWQTSAPTDSAPLRDLAADRAGFVYVVRQGDILKFDGATGQQVAVIQDEIGFDDVAVLPDGRLLGCACFGGDDLVFMQADGAPINRLANIVSSVTGGSIANLKVAVDGLGNIFILSSIDEAVFKYDPDGKYVDRFGGDGDAPGQFTGPGTLAVDSQGRVYVSDFKGIQVFTGDGQYLDVFDVAAGAVLGLAFNDQDELYAASNSNQVYKFVLTEP